MASLHDGDIESILGHSISERQGIAIRKALKRLAEIKTKHRIKPPKSIAGLQKCRMITCTRITEILSNYEAYPNDFLDRNLRLTDRGSDQLSQ